MLLQESKIYYWEIEVIMFIINIGGPGDQAVTVIVLRPTPQYPPQGFSGSTRYISVRSTPK